jgi:hypothetical protein
MPRMARVFSALFVAWFALLLVEPAMLHACPVHNAAAAPASGGAHSHDGHAAPTPVPPQAGEHCMCLGDCTQIAGAGLPSAVTRLVVTAIVHARDTGLPDYAYVPVAVAHAIPFANGPPTT